MNQIFIVLALGNTNIAEEKLGAECKNPDSRSGFSQI